MKKTTKILVLIASLVLLFSFSAIAAFAAETDGATTYYDDVKIITNATFDSVPGDFEFDGDNNYDSFTYEGVTFVYQKYLENPPRGGKIKTSVSLDGNKSMGYFGSLQKSTNAPYINISLGKNPVAGNKETSLKNYAYYVLDWDMSSPTGNYDKTNNLAFGYYFRMKDKDNKDKQLSASFNSITTDDNGYTKLGSTVLGKSTEWQHYTTILEVVKTYDANGNLLYQVNGYLFVDGVIKQTKLNMLDTKYSYYENYYAAEGAEPDTSLVNLTELRVNLPAAAASGKLGNESLLLDNIYIRSFTKYYSGAQQINAVISGSKNLTDWSDGVFTEDYQYPFGDLVATVTDAEGENTYYDNAQKAFANLSDGDVVELSKPVSDVAVENPIIVKTNGNAFDFSSSSYSAEQIEEGVYKFARNQNSTIKIYWDMPVGKDGYVYSDIREKNDLFTIATSVIGSVPAYPTDLSDYVIDIKDPTSGEVVDRYKLIGWAYSKEAAEAGEADTLRPITIFDIESSKGAWIALYPVFEKMDFRVIEDVLDDDGNPFTQITFYMWGDLGTALSKASAGATLQLRNDISTDSGFTVTKDLTFDLNGHSYIVSIDDGQDTVKDGGSPAYAVKPNAMSLPEGTKLTLKSSQPGGKVFVSAFVYTYNETKGEYTGYSIKGGSVIYLNGSGKKPVDITIEGENLMCYASGIVDSYSHNLYGDVKVYGGDYYRTVADFTGLFSNRYENHVNFEINDATLGATVSTAVFGNHNSSGNTTPYSVVFNNCKIYSKESHIQAIYNIDPLCSIYLNNCIMDGTVTLSNGKTTGAPLILGEGTVYNAANLAGKAVVADGCSAFDRPSNVEYKLNYNVFTMKANTEAYPQYVGVDPVSYIITPIDREVSFNTMIAGPNNSVVIEWYGLDGNLVSSSVAFAGYIATPPTDIVVPWVDGDGWRDFVITNWTHDDKPVTDFTIPDGFSGTYRFDAVAPTADAVGQLFSANATKLLWNISFGSGIEILFYVPVEDGVTINSMSVSGSTLSSTVKTIGVAQYNVYTLSIASTNAHVLYAPSINYTIDGVDYEFAFGEVCALDYIANVMTNESITTTQKSLLSNMVRYFSELFKIANGSVPTAYAEFLAQYPATEYPETYNDKGYNETYIEYNSTGKKTVSDYGTLKNYLDRIEVKVTDGDVSIWIYPTDDEVALGGNFTIDELEVKQEKQVINVSKKGDATVITMVDIKTLVTSDYVNIKFTNTSTKTRANAYYNFGALINSYKAEGKDAGLLESIYALANAMKASEGEEAVLPTYPLLAPAKSDEE